MDNFDLKKYLAEGKLLKENNTQKINTNVYYVEEYNDFNQEAVPEYEIDDVEAMLSSNTKNRLYIKKGTEGEFENGLFTTDEGSDTRVKPEYIIENKKSVDLKAVASYYGMDWFKFSSLSDKKRKEYKEMYIKHQEDGNIDEDKLVNENIVNDAAEVATNISQVSGEEPVSSLIFAGIVVGIATVASVGAIADVSGYRFSDVKDFFYDLWVKYRIKPIVKRLSKDPEVIELVKSGKPGWQNMLRGKLSKKEQLYVYDIYRKHFK